MSTNSGNFRGKPEVSASGILPKAKRGTARSRKPTAPVLKHERRGRNWLRVYVAGLLTANLTWGMLGIHEGIADPELRIHAMWAFGLAHAAGIAIVWFNKLE